MLLLGSCGVASVPGNATDLRLIIQANEIASCPNGSGATQWPRYDAHTDAMIQLDDTSTQINGYRSPQCDFYDLNAGAFSSLQ